MTAGSAATRAAAPVAASGVRGIPAVRGIPGVRAVPGVLWVRADAPAAPRAAAPRRAPTARLRGRARSDRVWLQAIFSAAGAARLCRAPGGRSATGAKG